VVGKKLIPTAIHRAILLFIITLPYESVDLGFMTGSLSIPRVSGLLFIAIYFFYHNPLFKEKSIPKLSPTVFWFSTYIAVVAFQMFFEPEEFRIDLLLHIFTLVQLVLMIWIISNLLTNKMLARQVLVTFALASSLLSMGNILGLPGFAVAIGEGRDTALGANPNDLGLCMALAILMVIGIKLTERDRSLKKDLMLMLLAGPLFIGLMRTGSRAALGSFFVASLLFVIPFRNSKKLMTSLVVVTFGLAATLYILANNPEFMARLQDAVYEGNTGGRDVIYTSAVEMVSERPLFGWGPITASFELGNRVGWIFRRRDPHNLLFELLIGVGIVGSLPFLLGLYSCGLAAWKARTGHSGMLPLALFVCVLIANLSHNYLIWKPQWLIFALILGAASTTGQRQRRSKAPLPNRVPHLQQ
jgi:O-antigen ligase